MKRIQTNNTRNDLILRVRNVFKTRVNYKSKDHTTQSLLNKRGGLKLEANTLRFAYIAVATDIKNLSPAAATVQIRHAKKTKTGLVAEKSLKRDFYLSKVLYMGWRRKKKQYVSHLKAFRHTWNLMESVMKQKEVNRVSNWGPM